MPDFILVFKDSASLKKVSTTLNYHAIEMTSILFSIHSLHSIAKLCIGSWKVIIDLYGLKMGNNNFNV